MSKTLNDEQNLNYLKLWRENNDEDALTLLVVSNRGLVKCISAKYINSGVPFDDLVSSGNEALIRAIYRFDYHNYSIQTFSTYISKAIESGILKELRIYNKHNQVLSFDDPLGYNKNGDELKVEEIIGTEPEKLLNDVVNEMKIEVVREALKCLTSRERQIILLRYGLNEQNKKTLKEIGNLLGISGQAVSQIEQKALMKMRHPRNTRKLKDFND